MIGAARAAFLAATGAGEFSPSDLEPFAWWDAQSLGLSDGAAVSTWPDSSGNSRDLAQSSAIFKPAFRTSGINGNPAVEFADGGGDHLTLAGTTVLPQPCTIAGVVTVDTAGQRHLLSQDGDSVTWSIRAVNGDPTGPFIGGDGFISSATTNILPVGTDQAGMLMVVHNGASTVLRTDETEAVVDGRTHSLNGELWVSTDSGTTNWVGDIGELLVFDFALSQTQRDNLYAYFAARWGL